MVDPQETTTLLGSDEAHHDPNAVWSTRLQQIQTTSLLAAHVLALSAVVMVMFWIYLLGGLSWQYGQSKQVFNWHPLLMIVAFNFMTVASLSFRFRELSRPLLKWTHGMAWVVAASCAVIAIMAVLRSHNDPISGFLANLYSFHSWVGCAVIFLYVIQFAVGIFSLSSVWSSRMNTSRILLFHKLFGAVIYNGVALTILLGIQEKEKFVGCSYSVSQADVFPWKHFGEIPLACRVSHLLGILVLCTALCANLARHDFAVTNANRHDL